MRIAPLAVSLLLLHCGSAWAVEAPARAQVISAMKKAAGYFREKAAAHGGYVYYWAPAAEVFHRNLEALADYLLTRATK